MAIRALLNFSLPIELRKWNVGFSIGSSISNNIRSEWDPLSGSLIIQTIWWSSVEEFKTTDSGNANHQFVIPIYWAVLSVFFLFWSGDRWQACGWSQHCWTYWTCQDLLSNTAPWQPPQHQTNICLSSLAERELTECVLFYFVCVTSENNQCYSRLTSTIRTHKPLTNPVLRISSHQLSWRTGKKGEDCRELFIVDCFPWSGSGDITNRPSERITVLGGTIHNYKSGKSAESQESSEHWLR